MPPQTDPQLLMTLVTRCRGGDAEAFEQIVALFRGPLYAYLARTTGDRHLAEDLLQDTFLRMVENLDRYEESGRLQAWLFRIASNRVRDWARRRSHSEHVGGMADPDNPDASSTVDRSVEAPPEEAMLKVEQVQQLEAALAALDDEERHVLLLRHYSDLSFKEIASIMNAPLGTVLARSHRALGKLRERMAAEATD